MGKKKQPAKTTTPMPAPQFSNFDTELTAARVEPIILGQVESIERHMNKAYQEIKRLGYEEGKLEKRREEYRKGMKDGEDRGRAAERKVWETKHDQDNSVAPPTQPRKAHIDERVQTEPTTRATTDSGTQTTATSTANAVTQTAAYDDTPTSPPSPPLCATSPLTTAAQPPSAPPTLSTTPTTAPSPPSKLPPAPRNRRHSLPNQPTAPHPSPQPRFLHPEPPVSTATSPPTTAVTPASTASETAAIAAFSTQTTADTSETAHQAANNVQRPPKTQTTELCDDGQTRLSKRVVHAPEHLCQLQEPLRGSGIPSATPSSPQLAPQAPVSHLEPPSAAATSYSTIPVFLAPPSSQRDPALSESRAAARERRSTTPRMSEHPPDASHPPSSLQNPPERAISPPPMWYTPPASPTTPYASAHTPRPPSTPCTPPIRSSSPQLSPRRAVSPSPPSLMATDVSELPPAAVLRPQSLVAPPLSPVPSRPTPVPMGFDWAEDTASMPAPPNMYPPARDLSTLRTNCVQPFGTLRQRTQRRRALPHLRIPPRQSFLPSHVQPPHSRPFITRRHPSGIGPGKPIITVPFGTPTPPVPVLNWEQDPRLINLSQALCALGWTPPC